MPVRDFITKQEVEDAPEDLRMAFAELLEHAETRLAQMVSSLSDDEDDWRRKQEIRHSFMNVVIALARRFEIEPIASMEVPTEQDFGYADYLSFRTQIDHYQTQLMVDNAARNRRYSVVIPSKSREKIRDYVRALREAIDKAELPDAKKAALHKKLSDFEAALDKTRLSLLDATVLTMTILGLPGAVWASVDVVRHLITDINKIVAEAKVADDEERRLPPKEEPAALLPPRQTGVNRNRSNAESYPEELDDEIPF